MNMSTRDWLLLILLAILWGGSFFFAEIALKELSPLVIVWARVGLAAVFLLGLLRLKSIPIPRDLRLWWAFLVMGVLNNVIPYSLIVWAQRDISGALASILNATTPIFTIILAHFLTRDEKLTGHRLLGVIVGFCGVFVLVGAGDASRLISDITAQLAVLAAAISYGCAAIWGRRFKGIEPMLSAGGQVTCSALLLTAPALLLGFPDGFFLPSLDVLGSLIGIALLCTVLAYILYFIILKTSGAGNLMLVTFLIPFSAIALGGLFLGERLETHQIYGMGLILAGLTLIDGRVLKPLRLKVKN